MAAADSDESTGGRYNDDQTSGRIKDAASLLIKGATLLNEQCVKCQGVQVRFKDKTICINCGHEEESTQLKSSTRLSRQNRVPVVVEKRKEVSKTRRLMSMQEMYSSIEMKLAILVDQNSRENDISIQKQVAELIEMYLGILERIRSFARQTE